MMPITMDFAAHAQEWIAAWNSHDLERIMAHYADDVELARRNWMEFDAQGKVRRVLAHYTADTRGSSA